GARTPVVLVDGEALRVRVGGERSRRRNIEEVVAHAVEQLEVRRELPVVLDEKAVEGRRVAGGEVAEVLTEGGVAEGRGAALRGQVGVDGWKHVLEALATHAVVADELRIDAGLEAVAAANPADVVDRLPDALPEVEADRIAVAEARPAELRDAGDGDRRTGDGRGGQRAELVPPRVLDAQLVERRAAENRRELRRRRIHPVGEVGRA